MIRLGHIEYSNCFPVHALLVSGSPPPDITLVNGTPAQLNALLEAGEIDAAPASSIEYARHAGRYRLLPDFVIASDGPVGSILFESTRPIAELNEAPIALPTASATSVVLLKILLALRHQVSPRYHWFDQDAGSDPIADGAIGAMWIGDVALRRCIPPDRYVYDLGSEWRQWLGLPFVFAAWQTAAPPARDGEIRELLHLLRVSREYFLDNAQDLATTWSSHFDIRADRLLRYWQSLRYSFDGPMQRGLLAFYRLAAQLGETPAIDRLRWVR